MSEILWGKYGGYYGPYFRGTVPYQNSNRFPTWKDKTVAVISATEGGRYDAINMYDRCIITGGLIQYCEAGIYLLSGLLVELMKRSATSITPVLEMAGRLGYEFNRIPDRSSGKLVWRFHKLGDPKSAIDTREAQQDFFLGCSGREGDWGGSNSPQRAKAMAWARAFADVLQHPVSPIVQNDKAAEDITKFYMPFAVDYLLKDKGDTTRPTSNNMDAAIAIYSSFAANLPSVAASQLEKFSTSTRYPKYSKLWLEQMCWYLTFGPKIPIYAGRYNSIRPVVERLFGVDLPDFAEDLLATQVNAQAITTAGVYDLSTSFGLQQALIDLGYDLGPRGADGIVGPKTKAAIVAFQTAQKLVPDGIVGPKTTAALISAVKAAK